MLKKIITLNRNDEFERSIEIKVSNYKLKYDTFFLENVW